MHICYIGSRILVRINGMIVNWNITRFNMEKNYSEKQGTLALQYLYIQHMAFIIETETTC